jgi:tRNA(fMet)-specific endonuclease VapC
MPTMILSLDTNVMVDLVNNQRPAVRQRYDEAIASGVPLVTSALAAHEFVYGAIISRRPDLHLANAEQLLRDLEIVAWNHEDGLAAARLRRTLRRQGRTIGATDALIAGQALARTWTMVSANLHEFERVESLQVIDWTSAAGAP